MADPTVKLVFTGNSADAERAIAGLERKYVSLEEKMKRAQASSRDVGANGANALGESLERANNTLTAMLGGGALLTTVFSGAVAEMGKFNDDVDAVLGKLRENATKFQVQDMLPDQAFADKMPQIKFAALQTPVTDLAGAIDAQRQLSSVGVDQQDLDSGAALQTMLRMKALSNAFGEQAESTEVTAKSITQFLNATGSGKGAADLERIGAKMASLSADSAINVSDLGQLSQNAGTLATFGVSEDEMLSAYRVAFESQGPMVGATGLKNFAAILATAGTEDKKVEALETFGLKPEDVAVAQGGVTLTQAMERLRAGAVGVDEVKKNSALKQLFGQDVISSAAILTSDTGFERFQAGIGRAQNAGADAKNRIGIFEGSREAIFRRSGIEKDAALFDEIQKGATWGEHQQFESTRRTKLMESASTPEQRMGQGYIGATEVISDWFHKNLLFTDPETAGGKQRGSILPEEQQRQSEELKKQTALLEKIANKEAPKPQPNPKGQREAVP